MPFQIHNKIDNTPRNFVLPLTQPILVRLREDVGNLPAPFTYELPRFEALRLVQRGVATVVGDLAAIPDVTLSEEEFEAATA